MTAARMVCAICARDIKAQQFTREPLGRSGALVIVCDECGDQPARVLDGPRLGYAGGNGPSLSIKDARDGLRKMIGGERYERDTEARIRAGLTSGIATDPALSDYLGFRAETYRRARAAHGNPAKRRVDRSGTAAAAEVTKRGRKQARKARL